MQIFKNFPLKQLISQCAILFFLTLGFGILQVQINSTESPSNSSRKKHAQPKRPKESRQQKTLRLVTKLNAEIEEQAHILSYLDKNDNNFEKQANIIHKTLNNIVLRSEENKIKELIDIPLIQDIQHKIKTYKKASC